VPAGQVALERYKNLQVAPARGEGGGE
jgi:hypothetical protein